MTRRSTLRYPMSRRALIRSALAIPGVLLSLLILAPLPAAAKGGLSLRPRETVVFLGDSITEQRLYTTFIEGYLLTRYPNVRFTFRNTGWGGDTAWLRQRMQGTEMNDSRLFGLSGAERDAETVRMVTHGLQRDVLPLKPTFVTIDFGMNDARGGEAVLPVYRRATEELVRQLKKAGARVALLTPSPEQRNQAGERAGSSYNRLLEQYSDAVRAIADKDRTLYADQFRPFVAVVEKGVARNPSFNLIGDSVHPGPAGHLVMAWAILKGLGADPLVSDVTVDASKARPRATAKGAQVSRLERHDGALTFTRDDRVLPMPLPGEASQVLPLAPILDDLSQYRLRVTGLKEGPYDVLVDGAKVTTISSGQLAQGWNMTDADTPMAAQATALLGKVYEKNNAYFDRWRNVQLPAMLAGTATSPETRDRLADLDRRIASLEGEINALREPKPHTFEIRPAQ